MAVDAMDIDSTPVSAVQAESEKERKRKHKHKDEPSSPSSKKKRKHEKTDKADKKDKKKKEKSSKSSSSKKDKSSKSDAKTATTPAPIPDSPYSLTTATLYLPLSPISISPTHALASLLAEHLSPLLLTFFPPFQGIILAYSNASISSEPPSSPSPSSTSPNPQPLTLAATAGEYGVMYVHLTATFLVFRPQRGQTLEGWVNVQSEGFLGAVVLNLFSVGIERKRLPPSWKWIPPGEKDYNENGTAPNPNSDEDEDGTSSTPFDPEKEHFNPVPLASDSNPFSFDQEQNPEADIGADQTENGEGAVGTDEDSLEGHFQSVSGHRVRGTVKFRVVDIDVIPGTERDRGFLSIEGTMLSEEEEAKVIEDERNGIIAAVPSSLRKMTVPMSSGGIIVPQVENVELESPSKKPKKSKK
ncbi:DNA-directed RNA polymerase I subunit RPA43 [Aspergillus mulundensis]|uniref:DNA-directed RNA polymerase subunit n=1 Tax=Aspergillus mulundensis TaxID=1810919 RepID=A0A3D8QHV0_9EURO|nr:hypothetical protein DSM5745_10738 [Aspergillus mulundensis]RDW61240.1 hypothetical protein DSM5745_10738 [Aspergillus mulundensis]